MMEPYEEWDRHSANEERIHRTYVQNTLCRDCDKCRVCCSSPVGFCVEMGDFLTEEELNSTIEEMGCD